ncbi:hypothetical protein CH063_10316 [Colletotrichum higginsianum]|uniref:Uncharacterized protein n=1 Tax=Colletotrichum higginsianum (strain IMI 349063) TaxID=759273 RepID=H1VGZ6_COLHI|nr:hypothetical protein CH063_10316 [Colletotrichum higginsianum]
MDSAKSLCIIILLPSFPPPLFLSSPSSKWKRSDVSPLYHLTIRRRWERGDAPTFLTYISPNQNLRGTHNRSITAPRESQYLKSQKGGTPKMKRIGTREINFKTKRGGPGAERGFWWQRCRLSLDCCSQRAGFCSGGLWSVVGTGVTGRQDFGHAPSKRQEAGCFFPLPLLLVLSCYLHRTLQHGAASQKKPLRGKGGVARRGAGGPPDCGFLKVPTFTIRTTEW